MKLIELAYFTENVQQMGDFYHKLLGTEPVARSDDMAIFMSGQTKIFIHRRYVTAEGELPADNHSAFAVEDVDTTCETLIGNGLTLEVPPKDYYWGRSAYLRDPDGHMVEIAAVISEIRDFRGQANNHIARYLTSILLEIVQRSIFFLW